ncbi:sugar ABC transporter substrate-binding protein [Nitratireductor sp. GCM10026969]|uniref:sugar ABC transporter substrate-binding protein n=1 Tax=Nitratireductor sp. GCM10026969 TaxID=3252645 RepID=UPI00361FE4DE
MLTRRSALLAAAMGAVMALPLATDARAQEEPVQIAYLSPSFDISDAWERVYWSMRARLDELGVEHEVLQLAVANAADHAGQLSQVESVIQRGADYVFLGATEYESAIPGLRKLKQAGIPTVVYNFLEPHEDETARAMQYIAFDHYEGGRVAGEWSAEKLGGKGKVAVLQGVAGVVSDQRMEGFTDVMEKHPDIEVIIGVHTDFDRVKAYEATENLLAAHPDLDLIYGVSTAVGLGIGQAVKAAGRSDDIYTLGFGGTGDEIQAIEEGWLSASPLRSIDDSGVAVADAFYAHMNGEEVEPVWSGPFVMVDADTDADEVVAHANRYSSKLMGR